MPLELVEDAFGDPRNAQFLAHASDLAYFGEAEGAAKFKEELGLDARLFSVGNTQAYLATNAEHIVVAFRGTESPTTIDGLKDWLLTDANNLLIVPEGRLGTDLAAAGVGARFHQGFVNAIADIWDPLFAALDAERQKQDRPIWLTGHSLGGALALLAAWLLRRKFIAVHQVYTFGGPMIGNREAIAAIDKEYAGKIFRYVNAPDPVPMLPTMSLLANHYGHCEQQVLLGAVAATVAAAGLSSAADFFQQFASQAGDQGLTAALIDGIWGKLTERVAAHSMVNYRDLVGKLLPPS